MELVLIKIDSTEWNVMWDWVAAHPINQGLDNPSVALNEGEAWQYTGSFKQDDKIISSFRHKFHPLTNRIETLSFANPNCSPAAIEKAYKL